MRYFRPTASLHTIIFLNDLLLIMDNPEQNYVADRVNSNNTTTPKTETRTRTGTETEIDKAATTMFKM